MASIYRKTIKRNGKNGKSKKYIIKYKDECGVWRVTPGFTSYELSQKKATAIEYEIECKRRGLVDPHAEAKSQPLRSI
jgi:hypothetical protein